MSGILFGLTALIAAYLADLLATHWGFDGQGLERWQQALARRQPSTKRSTSSRLNGQLASRSTPSRLTARKTGMRSP